MRTTMREKYLKLYSFPLLIAAGAGLVFWLGWLLLAGLYWFSWAEKGAAYPGIAPWHGSVLTVFLLTLLGGVLFVHWDSLSHTIGEDQAVIVKRLTRRGIRQYQTLYQGRHELPLAAWAGSKISLLPVQYHANEVVVWVEGHAARIQAQVTLHVIDPATYDRARVPLQEVFQRTLTNEVWQFSCEEVVNKAHRVNQAVLAALNTELFVYGLRADEYTLRKLCWVESGAKYHW